MRPIGRIVWAFFVEGESKRQKWAIAASCQKSPDQIDSGRYNLAAVLVQIGNLSSIEVTLNQSYTQSKLLSQR
jgi:hypothetical protein